MNMRELAALYYEKQQMAQELSEEGQDTGDEIYCRIGELLEQINDRQLAEKIDMLVLEMSDADRIEYFVKGFETALEMHGRKE